MKKYYLILFAMVFLLSCESEKDPCDIEYKLNEPGGFGRNEVTFLIDGETIWHSSQLVSGSGSVFGGSISGPTKFLIIQEMFKNNDGKVIKDSLGNPIYLDDYSLQLETRNTLNCNNDFFKNDEILLLFNYFNASDPNIEETDIYITSRNNSFGNGLLNSKSMNNITSKVYLNRKDSIIHGTFSGFLFNNKGDSIHITNGVFDYRYKSENYHGEM